MEIRPATEDDAATIAAIVAECDCAPAPSEYELGKARHAVASPTRRTVMAEVAGEAVGYASVDLAHPDLAHLSRLFVRPAHWGTGAAIALHEKVLGFAADYTQMRLFTPTANGRARRFYEREGWTARGTSRHAELGMELTEYRRAL